MHPSRLPLAALQTFAIREPLPTHWRKVACEQAEEGCDAHANGWTTACDLTTDLGLRQARYIRDRAGRAFTHTFSGDGNLITFTFAAGQQCFAGHRASLGRPALFVVQNGRQGRRVFDRGDQWMSDLHEATDRHFARKQAG